MIESYGISDVGCVRENNEDRILMDHSLGLFAVADGMGGHQQGEVAAELAISTLRYSIDSSQDRFDVTWPFGYSFELSMDANRLNTAIRLAGSQIWKHSESSSEYAGMGSTIAAVLLNGSRVVVGNVGDSRVYLFRAGVLCRLSIDDTWIASFARTSGMSEEEAACHPMKNVLSQAAGSHEVLDVHLSEHDLLEYDIVLLSSDGLHGLLPDERIREILMSRADVQKTAEELIQIAKQNGSPDNVSVILVGTR